MIKEKLNQLAPELNVSKWFNTKSELSLSSLRGRPVLIHAFQMLCPGCVSHAIPQTQKAYEMFANTDLAVIGLHTVFEHHAAMTPVALEAFIHEYRLTFPIGVDQPDANGVIPATMSLYEMNGTPTTIIINRDGHIAFQLFGSIDDMALGMSIQSALASKATVNPGEHSPKKSGS